MDDNGHYKGEGLSNQGNLTVFNSFQQFSILVIPSQPL